MSFAVVRGEPTAAQRYVDGVLAAAGAGDPARVSVAQLLHHCLRAEPQRVLMTNGATGVRTTNAQMLELVVPLARALVAKGLRGRRVVLAARDHERTVAAYLALSFAGAVPYVVDPACTKFELQYYLELVEPHAIFCDAATRATALAAVADVADAPPLVHIHTQQLLDIMQGYTDDIHSYRVADTEPNETVLLLPTSGSTGKPKAAKLDNYGLLAQLSTVWMHHSKFPTPTERVMVLTTPQWITFTIMLQACCVFRVELLMSPDLPSVDHVLHMMDTYRPTWTFFGPPFAKTLALAGEPRHFASLQTVLTLGSKVTPDISDALKAKLPPSSKLVDGYGMTEAQGFIAPGAPSGCNGQVTNVLHYRIVKEDGEDAALDEEGELYLKGDCIIKGYLNNEDELASSIEDGWLRTGDNFVRDAMERLYYRRRIKFNFKYNNQLVSPEELEGVIGSLPFVSESAVCEGARGPAAAVVLRDHHDHTDALARIHRLVDSTMSDHKRLRGGIAFVEALPRTHTGKLQRFRCKELLDQLLQNGHH